MDKTITIALGADHAGFKIKQQIKEYLQMKGYSFKDFGANSDEPSDYPDFAHPVACAVEKGEFTYGIVVCGSGNGVNMVVNKYQGIRSGLCWNKEMAHIVRHHNDANICTLPGRFINEDEAREIVDEFLNTEFEGGRHLRRINKMSLKNRPDNC
jgi:ribose 5-phosphate isomerase B